MPESITVDSTLGIIIINSIDLVGVEDLHQSLESVLDLAEKHGLNKVLVDASDLILLPTMLHLHSFASELLLRARNMKHAILVSDRTPKEIYHIETAALNRGLNIKTFELRQEALSWLNEPYITTNPLFSIL